MPKYKVKSALQHDGKDYKVGSEISLSEEQAEALLGHTLARPGEDLSEKQVAQVAQGVTAVENAAAQLQEQRDQLVAWENELKEAREQLIREKTELDAARDQLNADREKLIREKTELDAARDQLNADREKLAAERAEFDKTVKAAKK